MTMLGFLLCGDGPRCGQSYDDEKRCNYWWQLSRILHDSLRPIFFQCDDRQCAAFLDGWPGNGF